MEQRSETSVFSQLLPTGSVVVESSIDEAQAPLFPAEEQLITRAVLKRQQEFTAGRTCLRRALEQLDVPPTPILAGAMRNPILPEGISATITHSGDRCAAAAIAKGEVTAIGIDIEEHSPLEANVIDMILSPGEVAHVATLEDKSIYWDKLIFSAKEAFYKAYFQIVGEFLDFPELECTCFPDDNSMQARLVQDTDQPELMKQPFNAKYAIANGKIYTAFYV